MHVVPIRVSGELTIRTADLPPMIFDAIKASLTIPNEDRDKALSLNQFGWWDMPETVLLYRVEKRRGGEEVLCMPRGFVSTLLAIITHLGASFEIDDGRSNAYAEAGYYRPFVMRDYQLAAATRMLEVEQGFWKCPAGGGKTVGVLGAIAWSGQRALVITDKVGLANQWRVRAHQFYGMPVSKDAEGNDVAVLTKGDRGAREAGFIGQGVWEERDFTVALRQTLHERGWSADATGWWRTWGVTVFDEGHHLSAETTSEVSRKIVSRHLWAVSATPFKSEAKAAMVTSLVGPIIHETTRQELYDRKVLVKPIIEVLEGDLQVDFWPDHEATFDKEEQHWKCLMPTCKKNQKHRHRNNYSSALKNFVEDQPRAHRIARRILVDRGHVHLVASGQLKHLNLIRRELVELGWPEDRIWTLTGKENAEKRDREIIDQVMVADEAVVLSTIQVAGEGMDIPPIDRVHVVWAMKDRGATTQLVGRGERIWEGKEDSVVIDYREPLCEVFNGQYSERDVCYRMEGYDIIDSPYSVRREGAAVG